MKVDFLRHIVNPLVERYVKSGMLTPKDSIEIKRMIFEAEGKYQFSIYGGDVANLATYLKSNEFRDLVKYLTSINATSFLFELLDKVKDYYRDVENISVIIDNVTRDIETRSRKKETSTPEPGNTYMDRSKIAELAREVFKTSNIKLLKTGVKIELSPVLNLKISPSANSFKIELHFGKPLGKESILFVLKKVRDIAEKTSSI